MFTTRNRTLLFLLACLVSRLVFSIYYIEDIDSLRFALAAKDYSVADLRPHFPGYPLYCFFLRLMFEITHSVGASFAVLGGLSTFAIAYFTEKTVELLHGRTTFFIALLTFFNPLFFLMSTRYMPDIMGLALLSAGLYFLLLAKETKELKNFLWSIAMIGLLAGVRLSYVPFFLPCLVYVWHYRRSFSQLLTALVLSICIWLIPLIIDTGWYQLIASGLRHTTGHFNEWGGTVSSHDIPLLKRLSAMVESIWADGLGAWWKERHWLTILIGISWLFVFILAIRRWIKDIRGTSHLSILLGSCAVVYLIWAFFFQNITYKPRHVMPFVLFLILAVSSLSMERLRSLESIVFSVLIIGTATLSSVLLIQHRKPTAISQIKDTLFSVASKENSIIVGAKLDRYYLRNHKALAEFDMVDDDETQKIQSALENGFIVYSTIKLSEEYFGNADSVLIYFHNPYVNRLWSKRSIYTYQP